MEQRMQQQLSPRRQEGSLRSFLPLVDLIRQPSTMDVSSNDYLGLATCPKQRQLVEETFQQFVTSHEQSLNSTPILGATGSRLLSGDTVTCRQLEDWLATIHGRSAALVMNSGYDANLSVLSSLPPDVVVLMDELCHNSLVMGLKLRRTTTTTTSNSRPILFRHNDMEDLQQKLQDHSGRMILIIVESVYSMDGDIAPLKEILQLAQQYQQQQQQDGTGSTTTPSAHVMVDEAHGLGLYGPQGTGVLADYGLESHSNLFCSVHTFGKAAGCHGAVICGSAILKEYLINFARPFIYSTALPIHSLLTIQCAYQTILSDTGKSRRRHVFFLVQLFRKLMIHGLKQYRQHDAMGIVLWDSPSPIQALVVPGNDACVQFCQTIRRNHGIVLYPIRAPTVPRGRERVRIILHAHNTEAEVRELVEILLQTLHDMPLWTIPSKL